MRPPRHVDTKISTAPPALVGVTLLGVFLAAPITWAQSADTTRDYRYVMGTSVEVEAFGGDAHIRETAVDDAFGVFDEIDRLMSNYRDDSELVLVNRDAATRAVPVSDPLFQVLAAAERVSRASDGAFDITVGPLVRLWGFHDKRPHVPSREELDHLAPVVSYRNVLLDRSTRTVRFARPGVEIDLGGIAKGFAVEVAANVLRQHGLAGFIDAGGNQYLLGTPPGKPSWTVGIKDPDAPDRLLGVVDAHEGSISTSSDDSDFLVANGKRYGHVLDPRTLTPSSASLSVTIVARDATLADALSKAAFILGPRDGLALLDTFPETAGVIAYRRSNGSVGLALSRSLVGRFRPVPSSHDEQTGEQRSSPESSR
jgi:thiamine biosynthesis lipoprotein